MASIELDFRNVKEKAMFRELRDTIRQYCKQDIDIEALVDTPETTLRVLTFARMSNCKVRCEPCPEGHYKIYLSGSAWRCV